MNERIQELEEKAWEYVACVPYYDQLGTLCTVRREFNREKFAELIVKEMCQVMKAEGEQFSLDQNFDAVKGVGRCMRKVKEHFGVE